MPSLIIDDLEIEVPAGTKVIDAAEMLGIMIPRFCYHEALGAVGACRMCAVKFIHGPFKGIQMSCMIDAQDGMVVSTTDPEAVLFRKQVIEWLMRNHPHDCPVCDEGGQCLLQDETVSGGHGKRRYWGKKRTYRDQYLGPFIQHEMNRCIHCYRCSRYYQEFSGYRDLGPLQIGDRLYFGRFADGQLESPFSGNLVDICPTGVYTDKTARFKIRRWDLQRAPSLCISCSLGCNTIGNGHYRGIMRIEARFNEAVNGYFICDEGRFGFSYANGGRDHKSRPWVSRIGTDEVPVEAALKESIQRLNEISAKAGPGAVAVLGSSRNSLETQCMLTRVCRANKWRDPVFFVNPSTAGKVRMAVARLDGRIAFSMRELESSDFILVIGADPLNEAPMVGMAIRQAFRKGATVVVADPRPVTMPLECTHFPLAPECLEQFLGYLVRTAFTREQRRLRYAVKRCFQSLASKYDNKESQARIRTIAERLNASKRPAIVCGTEIVRESTPAFAADIVRILQEIGKKAGIFFILPGASSYSAALLSGPDRGVLPGVLEGIERGSIEALIAVETDPFSDFPDRERLEQAFSRLKTLIAIDYLPTETVKRASVFHPSSSVFETSSTYVNQEGRVQFASKVHPGGFPIWGAPPPRLYRDCVPGGDHRPAWEILWRIAESRSPSEAVSFPLSPGEWIAAQNAAFEQINVSNYPVNGLRILPEKWAGEISAASVSRKRTKAKGLELLLVDRMFCTRELPVHSDSLGDAVCQEACVFMHPRDAGAAGLAEGDIVAMELDHGTIEARLCISGQMADGFLILPRQATIEWQKTKDFSVRVVPERIRKVHG